MEDLQPLAAAIATGVFAVGVVWWQERRAAAKLGDTLERFITAFQSSEAIRLMVMQPLEGRWSYSAEFETFFGVRRESDGEAQFLSRGIASIQWHGDVYEILLGYSNRDSDGNKIAASVNTGVLRPMQRGLLQAGDRLRMTYVHRVGVRHKSGENSIDARDPKEDSYVFEVVSVETTESGDVRAFECELLEHATSTGRMRFARDF